jgi:RNA polymerase sigma-70 factor, ECF subfamily
VLILREVLGFSAKEVAGTMDTTVASVNSSLQRARANVDRRLPQQSQQATVRSLGTRRVRKLIETLHRRVRARRRGDDPDHAGRRRHLRHAPYVGRARGRDAIAASWLIPGEPVSELRYLPASANGQPAIAAHRWDPARDSFLPIALDVLTLRGESIAAVTAFRNPALFGRFGLPPELRK